PPTPHALSRHGALPVSPDAARVCEYAAPTVPPGSDAVVTLSAGSAMARSNAFVAVVFAESFTCTVKLAVLAAVGVPAITPAALSERPAGRLPSRHRPTS